ncbi:MAG: SDR family NAD(P)-dependent oxidoreductase, partial [Solirubrobacterales bacterium]|nr:SDR family NAD(P)-dependent oxidoreductase [Solirubrobacterales bacterium]
VGRAHGELHLLVNNAGARWAGTFAETGWENIDRHVKINFEAPVRLTETLLPLLRATAQKQQTHRVSIVNVSSTSGRVARAAAGGYSAAKFALAGWSDSLAAEEAKHGVHVGLVLPGFIATEGFPQAELVAHPVLRRIVSDPETVAEAIVECGLKGRAERYAPRPYWLAAAARILAPGLVRRAISGETLTPATGIDEHQ